jgi:N-formylglutamate deformylase
MIADHPSFHLKPGTTPLLVSLPHCGELIPDELHSRYHPRALNVEDTDWHLHKLYAFAAEMGASVLQPRASRFVIDLNRPSDNATMYPGANNTELCPTRFFTGDPIYVDGGAPTPAEITQRTAQWWQPYHGAIAIKSELPWLFEGRLPALNLGTVSGASCAPELRAALAGVLAAQDSYSHVVDGRFKGGYITRHYGRPDERVHAVQLEMIWDCYMDETPPYAYRPDKAAQVQPLLRELLRTLRDWKPQ